jgi:hypothetical protein
MILLFTLIVYVCVSRFSAWGAWDRAPRSCRLVQRRNAEKALRYRMAGKSWIRDKIVNRSR